MQAERLKAVDDALADLRETLNVDGFDLAVSAPEGERLTIAVTARADACVECLIPKDLFVQMLASTLRDQGHVTGVSDVLVVYPDASEV